MTVMVQKEVGARISAKENTKAYGSLSIAIQYYMDAEMAFQVPRTVFNPPPNVDSAISRQAGNDEPPCSSWSRRPFLSADSGRFKQRRKTLRNNFNPWIRQDWWGKRFTGKGLSESCIDLSRRGESLTIEEFASLANALNSNGFTA